MERNHVQNEDVATPGGYHVDVGHSCDHAVQPGKAERKGLKRKEEEKRRREKKKKKRKEEKRREECRSQNKFYINSVVELVC